MCSEQSHGKAELTLPAIHDAPLTALVWLDSNLRVPSVLSNPSNLKCVSHVPDQMRLDPEGQLRPSEGMQGECKV